MMELKMQPLRDELVQERERREALEKRIEALENKRGQDTEDPEIDKSMVVIGGFGDMDADDQKEHGALKKQINAKRRGKVRPVYWRTYPVTQLFFVLINFKMFRKGMKIRLNRVGYCKKHLNTISL